MFLKPPTERLLAGRARRRAPAQYCGATPSSSAVAPPIAASRRASGRPSTSIWRLWLCAECCWGGDAAAHAYSLDKAMKMYARVRTLDQVAAMLRE